MRNRKVYQFEEYGVLSEKKKAIKDRLNATSNERKEKRKEIKELSAEMRTLKRQLKNVEGKIG